MIATDPRSGHFNPALALATAVAARGMRVTLCSGAERSADVSAASGIDFVDLGTFKRVWQPIPDSSWKHLAFEEEKQAGRGKNPPLFWPGLAKHFREGGERPAVLVCDFTTFGCRDIARALNVSYVITAPGLVNFADPKVPATGGRGPANVTKWHWVEPALKVLRGARWLCSGGEWSRLSESPDPANNLRQRETIETMNPADTGFSTTVLSRGKFE